MRTEREGFVEKYFAPFAFLLGLIFGSFINVVIYRLPKGMSLGGRSACPSCGDKIRWYDLIPLLSYILLRGKCRKCGAGISPRYAIVELMTGVLFLAAFWVYGLSYDFILCAIMLLNLVIIAFIDAQTTLIYDRFVVIIAVLGAISLVLHPSEWLSRLIGIFAVSLPFLIIAIFGGMGGGDIKLMAAAGLYLGWEKILFALLAGSIAGGVYVAYLALVGKARRGKEVPFGPFLSFGIAAAALAGTYVIDWYFGLFMI